MYIYYCNISNITIFRQTCYRDLKFVHQYTNCYKLIIINYGCNMQKVSLLSGNIVIGIGSQEGTRVAKIYTVIDLVFEDEERIYLAYNNYTLYTIYIQYLYNMIYYLILGKWALIF